jgi:predicted DNA-binding protein with PD1-like motif
MADYLPLRLPPGADLRQALLAAVAGRDAGAAFVVAGVGSLHDARLRFAGAAHPTLVAGDLEILTLSGTLGAGGAHLHASVADAQGTVSGGHVVDGCLVRTTAEVLLLLLPELEFAREPDPRTGFAELLVRAREQKKG